ncbi:MAG: enoyl-CoA hydratase/isomerase family protein [Halioglobus sp.]
MNMQTTDFNDINYQIDSTGIVTLTLDTPARKNALSAVTFLELAWAVEHFQSDDSAHAMIITGAKDPNSNDPTKEAFSSGGYFNPDAFEGLAPGVMEQIDMSDIAQKRTTMKFLECDKPIFAAINGLAIGGAFTLAMAAADQIYVSEHAWVQLPFAKLGISAELGSTFILPRLLGFQKAKELLFFPEKITAHKLVELGIANAVVPHAELLGFTREKAAQLIPPNGAAMSIREMKRIVQQPNLESFSKALDLENEALGKLMRTEDFSEGLTARAQRRPPVFKGR